MTPSERHALLTKLSRLESLATTADGRKWLPGEAYDEFLLELRDAWPVLRDEFLRTRDPAEERASRTRALLDAEKTCPRCGETKAGTGFYVTGDPPRLSSWCRECQRRAATETKVATARLRSPRGKSAPE